MTDINNNQHLLESIIGVPVLSYDKVQVPVDTILPIAFPWLIHYELHKNHIELHVETSSYHALCSFLKKQLPDNESSGPVQRSFCEYAYMLRRRIDGWSNIEEFGEAIIKLRSIVEPVLIRYCEMITENLDLAHALGEYYEVQKNLCRFTLTLLTSCMQMKMHIQEFLPNSLNIERMANTLS